MSCCNCLKIKVLSDVTVLLPQWDSGNGAYVDVDGDTGIEFSKALAELNDTGRINDEAALRVSVPATDKNLVLFKAIHNHNLVEPDFNPLQVLVHEGSVTHNLDSLQATGYTDAGQRIECELKRSVRHWLEFAGNTFLNQIPIASVEFTKENLENIWANNFVYNDGDDGVYFPLVNYGGWLKPNEVVVEDFRPWINPLKILQEGFCLGEWKFICPWLETTAGRQLSVYPYGAGYGQQDFLIDEKRFRAHVGAEDFDPLLFFFPVILPFGTEDYDPNDVYDNSSYKYIGSYVIATFRSTFTIAFASTSGSYSVNWLAAIVRENADGTVTVLDEETGTITDPNIQTLTVNLEARDVTVYGGQKIYVYWSSNGAHTVTALTGFFENAPTRRIFEAGETIDVGALMDAQTTLLDFYKAFVHMCNGKTHTDWLNKTVTLYTPYEEQYFDETVEGFYLDEIEVITDIISQDSERVTLDRISQNRYIRLQFKESSDEFIKIRGLEEVEPLFSKLIDFGEDAPIKEIKKEENPLFEPTVTAIIDKFPALIPEITTYNVDIPHLWDNDEKKVSYDLGFRIVRLEGLVRQIESDTGNNTSRRWRFEGETKQEVPYSYQVPGVQLGEGFPTTPIDLDTSVVYGEDENDNDFYNLGYRKEYNRRSVFAKSSFDGQITARLYKQFDFRRAFIIKYNGRTFSARMLSISNRTACSDRPATMLFRPEIFGEIDCNDKLTISDPCINFASIKGGVNAANNTASATASNDDFNSVVDSETWEYTTDGSTFTPYTPGADVSFGSSNIIVFCRTINFADACPPLRVCRTFNIEDFCDDTSDIKADFVQVIGQPGEVSAIADPDDDITTPIASDVWQVSIDGGALQAYTPGTTITGFSESVLFIRTITFQNACLPLVTQRLVTADPPVTENCDNSLIEIVMTETAPSSCFWVPSIGGVTDSVPCFVNWQVSTDGGVTFSDWDKHPIAGTENTVVKAFVQFCDDCPPITVVKPCPF